MASNVFDVVMPVAWCMYYFVRCLTNWWNSWIWDTILKTLRRFIFKVLILQIQMFPVFITKWSLLRELKLSLLKAFLNFFSSQKSYAELPWTLSFWPLSISNLCPSTFHAYHLAILTFFMKKWHLLFSKANYCTFLDFDNLQNLGLSTLANKLQNCRYAFTFRLIKCTKRYM